MSWVDWRRYASRECSYCGVPFSDEKGLREHEKKCPKNPKVIRASPD